MIFVDANVPMYVAGADHPNKALAADALERSLLEGTRLVTSAEVLQEILHRYQAIRRLDLVNECLELVLGLVHEVFSVRRDDVLAARELMGAEGLGARDALHVAVMKRKGVAQILSFDRQFDRVGSIERLPALPSP